MPICARCTSAVADEVEVCPFCHARLPGGDGPPAGSQGPELPFTDGPLRPPAPPTPPGMASPGMTPPGMTSPGMTQPVGSQPFGTRPYPNPTFAPPPAPGRPITSRVETFDDALVPFLGDPDASRTLGRLVQAVAGALMLYNLARAFLWADFARMTQGLIDGTGGATPDQLLSLGSLIDTLTLLFWPTLIAMIVVDVLWRQKRRPKKVLQAQGEAYVEATISRAVPVGLRVGMGVLVGIAFVTGVTSTSPSRLHLDDIPGYATGRAVSSALWGAAWLVSIAMVWCSEQHLARRLEKAADPQLAVYTVPYVEPEAETGGVGQPSGGFWVLRTVGLVLLALVAGLGLIGGFGELPSGKDTAVDLIVIAVCGPAFGFVVWAFYRRAQRARQAKALSG